MPTGGSIISLVIQSESMGILNFDCMGEADMEYGAGGIMSAADSKMTASGKRVREQRIAAPYMKIELSWDMNQGTLESLAELSASDLQTATAQGINGITYVLTNCYPAGQIVGNAGKSTISLTLDGDSLEMLI